MKKSEHFQLSCYSVRSASDPHETLRCAQGDNALECHSVRSAPAPVVILSEAKNLASGPHETLRCAQGDNALECHSVRSAPAPVVILSEAKNLASGPHETLRCAQGDNALECHSARGALASVVILSEAKNLALTRARPFAALRVTMFLLAFALLAACAPAPATQPAQQTAVASMVNATMTAMLSTPSPLPASPTAAPNGGTTPFGSDDKTRPALTATAAGGMESRPTLTVIPTPTTDVRLNPSGWAYWPVVPKLSGRAAEIYRQGLAKGNDPRSFSTVGDCQSAPEVFMGIYATNRYWLGKDYQHLQETIDFYKDSFPRQSLAVRDGLSAPSALVGKWSDPVKCDTNESPVACDLRVHKPSIMFVNLGTNWRADAPTDTYERYLRQIVDLIIANGTLPILSTKADNIEGGHRINQVTARVAYDYDIPLWNLYLAVQDMPNHGLDASRKDVYLTVDAWDRRNFTALMTLDALRRALRPIYEQSK